ncbi:MAG: EAL domain-containing protein, partial [Gallionella sp.]
VTESKNAEREVAKLTNWQQALLDSTDYSIISTDADGLIVSINAAAQRMLGYLPVEVVGKHTPGIFHDPGEIAQRAFALTDELGRTVSAGFEVFTAKSKLGFADESEWTYIRKDGSRFPVRLSVTALYDRDDEITGFMGIAADLSEGKQAQTSLRDSNARYRTLFESAGDSIFLMEGDRFVDCNPATLRMFSCTREQIIGQPPYQFSPEFQPDGKSSKEKAMEKINAAFNGNAVTFEWLHCRYDGTPFDAEVSLNVVELGGKPHLLATVRDTTDRKAAEQQILQLAFYDSLTNLPNRQLLVDRLHQALASSTRTGRSGALLFIDLDNFKDLNDTLGHAMGDFLLKQVSERLKDSVREGDTVARLGGDEFVVMLEDLGEDSIMAAEQTEAVGEKVLAALSRLYQLDIHTFRSSGSIGATVFGPHSEKAEELLKQADIAMYQAKKGGRNILRFFDHTMQEVINARASLEAELHKALDNRQFQLHYQIQIDSGGHPLGAEALIRWKHPEQGMVSPAQFIPLAEETGLILPIGQWVLDAVCAQLRAWQEKMSMLEMTIAVNVSAKQFRQSDFISQVEGAVQHHGIIPRLLKLELTESALLEDVDATISTMTALKEIGVKLSLDDFGTGYSSLQYLKKLPLDQIKIDQSFVRDITTNPNDAAIVQTIISMTEAMSLDVIAEGVETPEQREVLGLRGCRSFQGYLFGRPLPIEQFEAQLCQH